MKRDVQSGKESPAIFRLSETESITEIGWLRRLMHGFPADSEHDTALRDSATRVIVHAIRTFGSEEKAYSWLVSSCGALNNELPYELLKAGEYKVVDEELDRIDYVVYV